MTIFKDEFDTRFVVMFTLLLFLKVFHWLCQDRVDSVSYCPFCCRFIMLVGLGRAICKSLWKKRGD
jgi:hypothetical protein